MEIEKASQFVVDSRKVTEGSLFFALPGEKTDGHLFLEEVARKGGNGAVVAAEYSGPDWGLELIRVPDVHLHLIALAKKKIASHPHCRIIGITGSLGKTTTKEFLVHLLQGKFQVAYSQGNSNTIISLPLTILNELRAEHEVLVLEMGMTHTGNIGRLVEIAPPDLAIVTTIALVHAANFSGLEEIAAEKFSIFSPPKTKVAVFPPKWEKLVPQGVVKRPIEELSLVPLPFPGAHFRTNLMAAAAAAEEMGMEIEEINRRIPTLALPGKRCERIEKEGVIFVSDCYNASGDSTIAALDIVAKAAERRVGVLGSMRELGLFSEGEHRRVGEHALHCLDALFCYGEETGPMADVWRKAGSPVEHFVDRRGLEERLRGFIREGDMVLVKGSNSLRMWELIDQWGRK